MDEGRDRQIDRERERESPHTSGTGEAGGRKFLTYRNYSFLLFLALLSLLVSFLLCFHCFFSLIIVFLCCSYFFLLAILFLYLCVCPSYSFSPFFLSIYLSTCLPAFSLFVYLLCFCSLLHLYACVRACVNACVRACVVCVCVLGKEAQPASPARTAWLVGERVRFRLGTDKYARPAIPGAPMAQLMSFQVRF